MQLPTATTVRPPTARGSAFMRTKSTISIAKSVGRLDQHSLFIHLSISVRVFVLRVCACVGELPDV